MQRSLLLVALIWGLSAANAAAGHEQMPFNSLRVGSREITFNVSMTLTQVTALLGKAGTSTSGDASEALAWLCYRTARGSDTAVLAIESSEMGGGTYVTSFELFRPGRVPELEHRCVSLALAPDEIVTDRGIRLGMTRRGVEAVLGRPTTDSAGVVRYDWDHGRPGRGENDPYTEVSSLGIWYLDGIVVRVSGDRVDQF